MKMTELSKLNAAFSLAALMIGAGCGELVDPRATEVSPITTINVRVNALTQAPPDVPLHAALLWSVFDQNLLDCIAQHPPFEGEFSGWLSGNDAQYQERQRAYSDCYDVHLQRQQQTDAFALTNGFAGATSIPIFDLPNENTLTVETTGQLGLASIEIFEDLNNNGVLDLDPPGTERRRDRVIGTSSLLTVDTLRLDYVLYREGALTPLWEFLRVNYQCNEEPPQGYSLMQIELIPTYPEDLNVSDFEIRCSFDSNEASVIVDPESTLITNRSCEIDSTQYAATPLDELSLNALPTNDGFACQNFDKTVLYTTDANDECKDYQRIDLEGCLERSSLSACEQSRFSFAAPLWWPCADLVLSDVAHDALPPSDVALDLLGKVRIEQGAFTQNAIVTLETPEGLNVTTTNFEFEDLNQNGVADFGDVVSIFEPTDIFNSSTAIGSYTVTITEDRRPGFDPVERFSFEYRPLATEYSGSLALSFSDASVDETLATQNAFFIDVLSGAANYPLSELVVDVGFEDGSGTGCEPLLGYERVAGDALRLLDNDANGFVGAGDRIAVVLPDAFKTTGQQCVVVSYLAGQNYELELDWGLWRVDFEVDVELAPNGLSSALNDEVLIRVTISEYSEFRRWESDEAPNWVNVRRAIGSTGFGADSRVFDDGDGLVNAGDYIEFYERPSYSPLRDDTVLYGIDLSFSAGGISFTRSFEAETN